MLLKASTITGCSIDATDGEIGTISDLLFDDATWAVRWLVVDTGGWLSGRRVLLPSSHLGEARAGMTAIPVNLTRDQVKDSPDIDTNQPVSRQMEQTVYDYYGWAPYWPAAGAYIPPMGFAGAGLAYPLPGAYSPSRSVPGVGDQTSADADRHQPTGDPHLRSIGEVTGYYIQGTDGDIGHVDDFEVDAQDWAIRYMVVDTGNWWSGKKVLIAPNWIRDIDWSGQSVTLGQTREEIRNAPEYDPDRPIDRDYESRLHRHYGAPEYWSVSEIK
ncbi:PRC-barrel domain-containing protein [Microvirga roseola]|uniref:PRC-barrel domain-containing protein n=1 Tax=Microvirga roseola TaxID=2883126 RepID=UPI001E5ED7B9|nr:PRC-barrel domain-containing protein [Microvirga roseola]